MFVNIDVEMGPESIDDIKVTHRGENRIESYSIIALYLPSKRQETIKNKGEASLKPRNKSLSIHSFKYCCGTTTGF